MDIDHRFFRRVLLVCAALFVTVGLVIALGVIPPVKVDTHPGVQHAKVVIAL